MSNYSSILPFGPTLKPLISHSTMSDADLREFLNSKGIFLYDYSREKVVPLLEVSLITPKDFFRLADKNRSKEDKTKRITKKVKIKNEFDLIGTLNEYEFDSEENSSFKNYTFLDKPELTVDDNRCVFEYRIRRFDAFKSWNEKETEHKGSVTFSLLEKELTVEAFSEHTATETKEINEAIINDIKKYLTSKNLVEAGEKISYIKFDDFTNEERVKFLLSFKDLANTQITGNTVADAVFAPDEHEDISKSDISWMKDRVRKLILNGKNLDEISWFEDEVNYKYIIIETLTIVYEFEMLGCKGHFSVEIGFNNIVKKLDPMAEFQFQINSVTILGESKKSLIRNIEKEIAIIINVAKQKKYEEIINNRM